MLFGRKSKDGTAPAPKPPRTPEPLLEEPYQRHRNGSTSWGPPESYIGSSLSITGDLHSEGDVRLDGHICGNVRCARLIVGQGAAVTGTVTSEEAIVRGRITGTIRAPVVILQDTAHVESDIVYTLLAIDDGANFEGAARRAEHPLDETETRSPLAELERLVTVDGTNGTAPNSHDAKPGGEGPALAEPAGTRNGRADTESRPAQPPAE
jgi:cytoskeletal protein CcmA (bactofilin family)